MKIKIGIRHNLLYPFLLIIFIEVRRIEIIIINEFFKYKGPFVFPILIFLSKFSFGLMGFYYYNNYEKKPFKSHYITIQKLSNYEIKSPDSNFKIFILIIIASIFDFLGTFMRKFSKTSQNQTTADTLEHSVRSLQVFISAILCYNTIRIKIYKHQFFSLIIIIICVFLIFLAEMICVNKDIGVKIISFLLTCFSCFCRAFLDTIEKYLFEFDFMNPFKCMMFEGLINTFLTLFLLFIFQVSSEDIKNILKIISKQFYIIIFLIIYFLISGFKNIYRVITIKMYSPMTRALCESIFDPFLVVYYIFRDIDIQDLNFWIYFGVILFASIIMPISSCIYNEFFVLYCCGLEHETHLEITKRSVTQVLEDDNSSESDEYFELEGEDYYLRFKKYNS